MLEFVLIPRLPHTESDGQYDDRRVNLRRISLPVWVKKVTIDKRNGLLTFDSRCVDHVF